MAGIREHCSSRKSDFNRSTTIPNEKWSKNVENPKRPDHISWFCYCFVRLSRMPYAHIRPILHHFPHAFVNFYGYSFLFLSGT